MIPKNLQEYWFSREPFEPIKLPSIFPNIIIIQDYFPSINLLEPRYPQKMLMTLLLYYKS